MGKLFFYLLKTLEIFVWYRSLDSLTTILSKTLTTKDRVRPAHIFLLCNVNCNRLHSFLTNSLLCIVQGTLSKKMGVD